MVLLDDVVEVLRLAQLEGHGAVGLDAHDGGRVGAALVNGDLLGYAMKIHGPFEEPLRRRLVTVRPEQEVHSVAVPINGAVQILPLAADLDAGLVHAPAPADRAVTPPKHRYRHRQDLERPAVHRGAIDEHAAFDHHLLDVAQAQRIRGIPTYAHQHDLQRRVHPLDDLAQLVDHQVLPSVHLAQPYHRGPIATEPDRRT